MAFSYSEKLPVPLNCSHLGRHWKTKNGSHLFCTTVYDCIGPKTNSFMELCVNPYMMDEERKAFSARLYSLTLSGKTAMLAAPLLLYFTHEKNFVFFKNPRGKYTVRIIMVGKTRHNKAFRHVQLQSYERRSRKARGRRTVVTTVSRKSESQKRGHKSS